MRARVRVHWKKHRVQRALGVVRLRPYVVGGRMADSLLFITRHVLEGSICATCCDTASDGRWALAWDSGL